jgi:thiol-disulfide isomerase/thioredoxin|tara:strand:- start:236 stop:634 length:399 start_codon:yes stop_codon:yes gene_type:complete
MTQEIDLENREDLIKLLNSSEYKFIIIKFTATWCRPCKVIQPFLEKMVDEKIEKLNAQQKINHFLYIELDVDVCFDLYAFLKKKKAINGIPCIYVYNVERSRQTDDAYKYLPHGSFSGTDQKQIQRLFDMVQ